MLLIVYSRMITPNRYVVIVLLYSVCVSKAPPKTPECKKRYVQENPPSAEECKTLIEEEKDYAKSTSDQAWKSSGLNRRRTWSCENRTERLERLAAIALTAREVDCPAVQVVPPATGWTADQTPLAHCWKEVPPMQFHIPSVVQAVPAAMADPVPVVPVLAGDAAEEA